MKIILFLLILLGCQACVEDTSVDPTLMPEATSDGQNTLGCLIDGWVYTSGRFGYPEVTSYVEGEYYYVTVTALVDHFKSITFTLVNPTEYMECDYIHARFNQEELEDGKAYITSNDGKVISGIFCGGNIEEGRFDIKYAEGEEGGTVIAFK